MNVVSHRCKDSLFLRKSIRKEEFCGLEYWIIRDYIGYEPLFDDYLDSIVNLKYCPFCGKYLNNVDETDPLLETSAERLKTKRERDKAWEELMSHPEYKKFISQLPTTTK